MIIEFDICIEIIKEIIMEPTNYSTFNRSKNQVNLNVIHEHEESSQEKTSSSSEDGLTSYQKYITTLILFYIMMAYVS